MSEPRKFYRTTIKVVVISEGPYNPETLGHVHWDITEGDASGEWDIMKSEELTPKRAANALLKQGSDPEFLGLSKDGTSI